jgi:hypothetical protein
MRRIEFIINEIRRSTNNRNTNKLTDFDMINYLNRAQREIQRIIFEANVETNIFNTEYSISLVRDQESYDLPSDIYAQGGITSVLISPDGTNFSPIRRITPADQRTNYGYFIIGNKIHLSPVPTQNFPGAIKLIYTQQVPFVGFRFGEVISLTSGVSVRVSTTRGEDITQYNDYFTIVDKDGVVRDNNLSIDSYNLGTKIISTSSTFVNAVVGDYVILGKNSTSSSILPDACEDYLMNHAERSIFKQDSSSDLAASNIFTAEEKQDLIMLFQNNIQDTIYPPIVDTTYIWV